MLIFVISLIFSQNLFFSRGLGADALFRISADPRHFFRFGLVMSVMTVVSSLTGWAADRLMVLADVTLPANRFSLRALVYLVCVLAVYAAAASLLRRAAPSFYRGISAVLPAAVINTAVMGAPLIFNRLRPSFMSAIPESSPLAALIFGVAAGAGFLYAFLLVTEGMRQLGAMDLPRSFEGVPAKFIYVGLLSLALCGISSSLSAV